MKGLASLSASMTPDAVRSLEQFGMSRRRFLKVSGVLAVGFSASPLETGFAQRTAVDGPNRLDAWIAIASDGTVIESVLINRPDAKATGAGETAVTLIGAALGNAIFDGTGVRLRQEPFTPARVRAALASRV